jgi:hypothetical protein
MVVRPKSTGPHRAHGIERNDAPSHQKIEKFDVVWITPHGRRGRLHPFLDPKLDARFSYTESN